MSVFSRFYNRINWKNLPDVSTPLNAYNLNNMDFALYNIDNRVVTLSNNIQGMFTNVTIDSKTGVITLTKFDGSITTLKTNMSKLVTNFDYDSVLQSLVLTLEDGSKTYISLADLITEKEFEETTTISPDVVGGNVRLEVKDNSITESKLETKYFEKIKEQVDKDAIYSADTTANAQSASNSAKMAESYCHGGVFDDEGIDIRENQDTDNAKYYKDECNLITTTAVETCNRILTEIESKTINVYFDVDIDTGHLMFEIL